MSLYPSILFHFTDKFDSLTGILNNNFLVSYSREKITALNPNNAEPPRIEFYVPMVSFCDLRLSELEAHMKSYGFYGIGLTKDWAVRKKLNPVMYVEKNSNFTYSFVTGMLRMHQIFKKDAKFKPNFLPLMNSFRYMKNYQDELRRKCHEPVPNYLFANEREWRYVPPIDNDSRNFLTTSEIDCDCKKKAQNLSLNKKLSKKGAKLTFEVEDIKYLIVPSEKEITDFFSNIRAAERTRFTAQQIEILRTRIITKDQILNDI